MAASATSRSRPPALHFAATLAGETRRTERGGFAADVEVGEGLALA